MKHLLFLLFWGVSFSVAQADPWDCVSKSEAEQLLEWIKENPFLLQYCDCCHDEDFKTKGKSNEKATLLYITKAEIVPCEYDAERFSVKMKFIIMSESKVSKEGEIISTDQNNPSLDAPYILLTLNQHFTTKDNMNFRVYEEMRWVAGKEASPCLGLMGYPNPGAFRDELGKKYQKWATKRGTYWKME